MMIVWRKTSLKSAQLCIQVGKHANTIKREALFHHHQTSSKDVRGSVRIQGEHGGIQKPSNLDLYRIGATEFFVLMPYGDEWRNHRRLFQQYFSPKALDREQEKALEFVRKALLPNLYQDPRDVHGHVRE